MRVIAWGPATDGVSLPADRALEEHLAGIRHPGALRSSRAAWALLYRLLSACGREAGALYFEPGGKPRFRGDPVWFSLSHSGELCAAAVADVPAGVDVERVRPAYRESLIRRCLSPAEAAGYDGDFPRLWCRKESLMKLTGEGLVSWPAKIDTLDGRYTYYDRALTWQGEEYRLAAAFPDGAEPVTLLGPGTPGFFGSES